MPVLARTVADSERRRVVVPDRPIGWVGGEDRRRPLGWVFRRRFPQPGRRLPVAAAQRAGPVVAVGGAPEKELAAVLGPVVVFADQAQIGRAGGSAGVVAGAERFDVVELAAVSDIA